MNEQEPRTPIPFQPAGFWKRFIAWLIDFFVLLIARTVLGLLVALVVYGILQMSEATAQTRYVVWIVTGVIGALLNLWGVWLYFALMESSTTQGTLGKMAVGIKVCDEFGNMISFDRATARYFAKIVSRLTSAVGYIMCAFTTRKQALHDIICSTTVSDKAWH